MANQLPAGMRNNNPGNIKYIGQKGTTPSVNTDQGDPQAVYASPEAGMAAMYDLLNRKYQGGKRTVRQIIADQGGWTPGNIQAAQNIAAAAGIGIDDDIGLSDPGRAVAFMKALTLQEHGQASSAYSDDMYANAVNASAGGGGAAVNVPSAAFPYKLYGGATREDAITGMNRQFSDALIQLYNAAPPEVQKELGLNSAYRSKEIQQQLWDKSDKTGRRVAAPGKSRHQHGEAADLFGFGLTKDQVSQTTRDWVAQNATKYGLGFPVQGEPWHIQLMRAQGQAGPGARPASPAAPAIADPHGAVVANALADKPKKKSAGLAKALMDNPFEMSGGGYQTNLVAPAAPAALAQAAPTSMVNPQQVEQRRAALAAIMQRLNSGSLS
jgi:hypothetical protein